MYNKYTYECSKPMNINSNISDCFEEVERVDIKKIFDDINSKFIENLKKEEKEKPITRFNKYTRIKKYS